MEHVAVVATGTNVLLTESEGLRSDIICRSSACISKRIRNKIKIPVINKMANMGTDLKLDVKLIAYI